MKINCVHVKLTKMAETAIVLYMLRELTLFNIKVFGKNLVQLLMAPPIAGQVVLGWDPAFRTGCKLAVVDPTGKVLDTVVIYPTAPQNKVDEAKVILKKLID